MNTLDRNDWYASRLLRTLNDKRLPSNFTSRNADATVELYSAFNLLVNFWYSAASISIT
jgi:hypothetical protein